MSLATRCTACGTVFRVVQDQLKVSEGWVRCGRCNEVFNALEGLFDLERDAPTDWKPEAPVGPPGGPGAPGGPAPAVSQTPPVPPLDSSDLLLADKVDAQLHAKRSHAGARPAAQVSERDRLDFPDAEFGPEGSDEPVPDGTPEPDESSRSATLRSTSQTAPTFLRGADHPSRWGRRASVGGLVLVALLLAGGLLLQVGHHFRDLAAARWPVLLPVYAAWCGALHCAIGAPLRIDAVAVESTALTRDTAPDAFRLSVLLRNHGDTAVALPSIDLSLTDSTGQLVARRVLAPQPPPGTPANTVLRPGGESAQQWILTAGSARVSGYTVEIFYP